MYIKWPVLATSRCTASAAMLVINVAHSVAWQLIREGAVPKFWACLSVVVQDGMNIFISRLVQYTENQTDILKNRYRL